jgi:intein-encoded DNA endonuclease-like protein
MNEIRPVDRAYIAGFFDGEGCITSYSNKRGRPRISMSQNDPEVLHRIQKILGYGNVRSYQTSSSTTHWRLDIAREEWMRHFITTILKYSVVKRKKLQEAKRWFEERG